MARAKGKAMDTTTLKLPETLAQKEEQYHGRDDIFGMTLLTRPGYISSGRSTMFTSHLRQFVNLEYPDFPAVFTNYENTVGKNSTGFYQAKEDFVVIDKIPKFQNGVNDDHIYLLFIYDRKNDRYDVIEKRVVEDLTEKFGFQYNNTVLDQKDVGAEIAKDEVLYKTTSYDEDMNYCYGKNVKFAYMLDPYTIEDAIVVSESLANRMLSKEIETVKVSFNDNDIPCNLYGDSDHYQGFPNIGEYIKDKILCAKRRIHNAQLLYDLKRTNLRRINFSSDVPSYSEGRIVDINIFCNKPIDEIEDNDFTAQMKHYVVMQRQFYQRVFDRCQDIIESGSKYSSDINFYFKKARDILDDNYKWREEDNSVFNNIVIEFVVERSIRLSVGQKITGRYGNKGVIALIRADHLMPTLETGEIVDVIFNTLGVINRLNSQQLFEQSLTFVGNRVLERMRTLTSLEEREDLLCRTLWYFNSKQEKAVRAILSALSVGEREAFIQETMDNRIHFHTPPMWDENIMFDQLAKLYKEFTWIKPYNVYVNQFGRRIRILKPLIVGDMYVIKLKQTSKKGFSVRATGSLSKKGIPEKSNKVKNHQEPYSKTPIRIGDQENINAAIGVPPEIIAQLHMYYRSSPMGRRYMGEALLSNYGQLDDFTPSEMFSDRNVEILQAYFKALGLKLEFSQERMDIKIYTNKMDTFYKDDKMIIGTLSEYERLAKEMDIRNKYDGECVFVGSTEDFEKLIFEELEREMIEDEKMMIQIGV